MRVSTREVEAMEGCRGIFLRWVGRAGPSEVEGKLVKPLKDPEGRDTKFDGASEEL